MNRKMSFHWITLVSATLLLCLSGQMCGSPGVDNQTGNDPDDGDPAGSVSMAGTYTGTTTAVTTTTATANGLSSPPSETSTTYDFELSLDETGRPTALEIPTNLGEVNTALFEVGATSTSDRATGNGTITTALTCRKADLLSNGFHVSYDITMTMTMNGGGSTAMNGTAEYTGTVEGDVLTYEGTTTLIFGDAAANYTYETRIDVPLTRQP